MSSLHRDLALAGCKYLMDDLNNEWKHTLNRNSHTRIRNPRQQEAVQCVTVIIESSGLALSALVFRFERPRYRELQGPCVRASGLGLRAQI